MKKIYILCLLCISFSLLKAQWTDNTSANTIVANKDASDIQTANTNDGRTWIAFYSQNGSNYDMRVQLLDADGNRQFGNDGLLVSDKNSGSATYVFNVCVDKDNNLIIAFQVQNGSAYECVAQKVNTAGQLLWGSGVDLGAGLSPYPAALSTNEIAIAWNDNNGKIDYQKISSAGAAAWASPKIFSSTHSVTRAQVLANTNGNFSMVYQDQFSFPFYTNLFEQQFDNDGNALWTNAVKISTLTTVSYRYYDVHIEDDITYVGYYGNPSGSNRFDAYVQRINADGGLPWGSNGSYFANYLGDNDPSEQTIYIAKKPGTNDVWAVCTVTNSLQTESGVYVQKYDAVSGNNYFGATAKEVLPITSKLISLAFCQLSLCDDNPVFLATSNNNKLVAIKLNSTGDFAWKNNLRLVGGTIFSKFRYGFTNFYKGQAVAVWQEDKGTGNMPYAENIRCSGIVGASIPGVENNNVQPVATALSIKSIYPNPVQNVLKATITSAAQTNVHIYITDVSGNILKQFQQNINAGNNAVQFNVSNLNAGSYFIKIMSGSLSGAAVFSKQ
jgi:hypothetical protein